MNIQLSEQAFKKLDSKLNNIQGIHDRSEILNKLLSGIVCQLDDSFLTNELNNALPIESLIRNLLTDEKSAKRLKEYIGIINRKQRKKRTKKETVIEPSLQ